jgi:histidyl-tRNA synthetase
MAKFNTKPVSGTRDFLALDVLRRNYLIQTVERVYQSYGFEPLETPVMERLDTLLGKYGEEGDQLIFRILKRGAKLERALNDSPGQDEISDSGMRYDLTVPLARVVAEYRHQLPRYYKRYQMQPVYRADRPAKGRYREIFQCDVDIVGSSSQTVEAEVIGAAAQVLQELGFQTPDAFRIRLNHRGVLKGLMEVAGVPLQLEGSALVAIDKLDKIGMQGVRQELEERGIAAEASQRLLQMLADAPEDVPKTLEWLVHLLAESELGSQAVGELKNVVAYAAHGPAASHIRLDPYLARGLSYYTGPIFEVELPGLSSSGGGGGRYDELVGMFSNQTIPACGFSLGLERILLVMEERGLFPERLSGQPQVLVTQFDENTIGASLDLARQLRSAGLRVDLYPDMDRYGKQFKYAEERGIRYALLIGPQEMEATVVAAKDLISGDQEDVAVEEIVNWLRTRLE